MSSSKITANYRRVAVTLGILCVASASFLTGMLFQAGRSRRVEAMSTNLYELMVYHALPGKAPALESVFQGASKLQVKHGLNAVGYWVPDGEDPAWRDTFVYLLAHSDRPTANKNWQSLHNDPAFKPFFKAAAPLIRQKDGGYLVDEVYMSPTDYSTSR